MFERCIGRGCLRLPSRSTRSATSCVPGSRSSSSDSRGDSTPGSPLATPATMSPWPGSATRSSAQRSRPGTRATVDASRSRCPRGRPTRLDPAGMAPPAPGLLHHRTRERRRDRGHQQHHRTPPPHRPRLTQHDQLPATDDPGRRTTRIPDEPDKGPDRSPGGLGSMTTSSGSILSGRRDRHTLRMRLARRSAPPRQRRSSRSTRRATSRGHR
jgi:hypothetical protein